VSKPDLEDQAEDELDCWIEAKHFLGLSYWQILGLFLKTALGLYVKAQAEYWLHQGK